MKKGNHYVMTKVSHDGYDLEENKQDFINWLHSKNTPEEIVGAYLLQRNAGDFEVCNLDINNPAELAQCMYVEDRDDNPDLYQWFDESEQKLVALVEKQDDNGNFLYDENHPYQTLACSYADCILKVDMDLKVAELV